MWYVGGAIAIYLVLILTLGVLTFRKRHWVMFGLGFLMPVFWLIGAIIPPPQRLR